MSIKIFIKTEKIFAHRSRFFGAAVREARKQRKISQEQLAFDSGLDRSFLSQVECGRKQPSLVTIFPIAKALATPPAQLLAATELKLKKAV